MRELCQQPHDVVLLLMEKLLARARKTLQCAALEVLRLMPALHRLLQKTEEFMRAGIDRDTWLPEVRETKLSPMERYCLGGWFFSSFWDRVWSE
jgi:hypothetical protein